MNRNLIECLSQLLIVLTVSCLSFGRCADTTPVEPIHNQKFFPGIVGGNLVCGHVANFDPKKDPQAFIEIDQVLFGEPLLVGKRFAVPTMDDTICGLKLKPEEKTMWVVYADHGTPHFGSDGLKHTDPKIEAHLDLYGFGYQHWPVRESDKEIYDKMPAMAAVLTHLEASKDGADFNLIFPQIIKDEQDVFLAAWEKTYWGMFRPIVN